MKYKLTKEAQEKISKFAEKVFDLDNMMPVETSNFTWTLFQIDFTTELIQLESKHNGLKNIFGQEVKELTVVFK